MRKLSSVTLLQNIEVLTSIVSGNLWINTAQSSELFWSTAHQTWLLWVPPTQNCLKHLSHSCKFQSMVNVERAGIPTNTPGTEI